MIRGGHVDVAILGAFEVAANGDLANWDMRLPDKGPLVGGAMDLAACARSVWVIMEHVTRKGAPRLLASCALPLTAVTVYSLAGFSGHYHHANASTLDERIRQASFRRESIEQVPLPGPLAIYWVSSYRVSG